MKTIRTHNTNSTEPTNGVSQSASKHKLTEVPKNYWAPQRVYLKPAACFLYVKLLKM